MPGLIGVGVDIVEVARITRLVGRGGRFASRWFSEHEAARCWSAAHPDRAFASLLASKEAVWKSMGMGSFGPVPWGWMTVSGGTVSFRGPVAEATAGVGRVEVSARADARLAQAWAFAWEPLSP